jgi:hypothetical protein
MRFLGTFPVLWAVAVGLAAAPAAAQVVINEVVVDPQRDWSDSTNGIGIPFDSLPGTAAPGLDDEWIELYNKGPGAVDMTGWDIIMTDVTMEIMPLASSGALVFSNGGSLASFKAGEYLVLGNPQGSMDNASWLTLRNAAFATVDEMFPGGGMTPNGDATSTADESVARIPNGADTGNDVNDLRKVSASIGATNARILVDGFESGTFYAWSFHS